MMGPEDRDTQGERPFIPWHLSKVKNSGKRNVYMKFSSHDHTILLLYLSSRNSHLLKCLRALEWLLVVRTQVKPGPRRRHGTDNRLGTRRWFGLRWRSLFRAVFTRL